MLFIPIKARLINEFHTESVESGEITYKRAVEIINEVLEGDETIKVYKQGYIDGVDSCIKALRSKKCDGCFGAGLDCEVCE